MTVNCSSEDSD